MDRLLTIEINIDEELKKSAEEISKALGISLSVAINMFLHQFVLHNGFPFEVTPERDPFYSESNIKVLRESIQQANEGKFVIKTMEELEAMEE